MGTNTYKNVDFCPRHLYPVHNMELWPRGYIAMLKPGKNRKQNKTKQTNQQKQLKQKQNRT